MKTKLKTNVKTGARGKKLAKTLPVKTKHPSAPIGKKKHLVE